MRFIQGAGMKRIIIVGGGISGMTVAHALLSGTGPLSTVPPGGRKEGYEVTVLEADSRPGGKIWTDRVDGFLCEKGPNGFLDNKPKTLELCQVLGLTPLRSNENAKKRYIFFHGRLNPLPESPPAFIRSNLISWPGKIRMAYDTIAPKGPEDETVADFIKRRLGKEALERLIDPMVSGVFAGDPYRMSIKSCFPRIKELEQEHGSLIRAMIRLRREKKKRSGGGNAAVGPAPGGTLTSFHGGAQTLTDTLFRSLKGHVRFGVSATGIGKKGDGFAIHTSGGVLHAEIVVLATPAHVTADIVKDLDDEISKTLSGVPYPSVTVLCFGYRREKVGHPLDGFGFLIPHKEGRNILGTLWDSSIFPDRAPEGYVLLRTMVGGARASDIAMMDDSRLIGTVLDDLRPIVSLKADPDMVRIYRWEKAIPQYVLGHDTKLQFIERRLKTYPGLYVTGNAFRGVGINDCVSNGYRIAGEILSAA